MGSVINNKRARAIDRSHKNFMGGESYDISPILRLRTMAASCFFGEPAYYKAGAAGKRGVRNSAFARSAALTDFQLKHLTATLGTLDPKFAEFRGLDTKTAMERAIDEALAVSVEETLRVAVALRNEDMIRVTPQVILVRAANNPASRGTGLVRKYAPMIVKRADEPNTCIAYQLATFGKPIPNSLKRALGDVMAGYDEYVIAKYRQDHLSVSMKDVVRLVHPKNELFRKLLNDEVKNSKTWESIRSGGGSWDDALNQMGHMALLRNLRNLLQANVDAGKFAGKLVGGAKNGKQLPFRYLSAYKEIEKLGAIRGAAQVLGAIDECINLSVGNLPRLNGRSLVLSDNSGSAWGAGPSFMSSMHVAEIGNLMGVLTARASDEGVVGVFGDRLELVPIKRTADVLETTNKLSDIGKRKVGQATENGIWIALRDAIKGKVHWDNIFVYSDMQAGHGGLYGTNPREYSEFAWGGRGGGYGGGRHIDVAKLVSKYRSEVNPNVNVFLVQTAGYGDTIIPEVYNRTYILGGWSGNILRYASKMSDITGQ